MDRTPYTRRPQQSADGGDEAQGSDAGEEAGKPADGELGAVGERDEAHELVHNPEGGLRLWTGALSGRRQGRIKASRRRATGWRGLLATEQRASEREVGLGCERARVISGLDGGSSAQRWIWRWTERESD
jgi:hypothetical protein